MGPLNVTPLLAMYGYWAVLLFVTIESTGIPCPGETMLLIAAIAAGTTHQLAIPWVIVAAASGAILRDNLGFWIGREGGYYLLRRYGRFVRLDERKLKLGQYLFLKHGGKAVFFGRFVTVLRAWAASPFGNQSDAVVQFSAFQCARGNRVGQPGGTGWLLSGRQYPSTDGASRDWRSRAGRTPQPRFSSLLANASTPSGSEGRASTAWFPG